MSTYTKIPTNTFKEIQLNAGVLLKNFVPKTGALSLDDIIGATSGGIKFSDTPSYTDYGDDIDNCPKNTKELKRIDSREVKMTGTYITVNTSLVKSLMGAATIDSTDNTKVTAKDDLDADEDFEDLWWVGDYSDEDGGYIAIHMLNVLSTGGFKVQSGDKSKGNFEFEYSAHYSISAQDIVPYEIYVKAGTSTTTSGS